MVIEIYIVIENIDIYWYMSVILFEANVYKVGTTYICMVHKILRITDDSCDLKDDEEMYNELFSLCGDVGYDTFSYKFIDVLKYVEGFDSVFIDYGMIGDYPHKDVIRMLQDYYNNGVMIFWQGGLSCINRHYINAAKTDFKQKFIHNIPEIRLDGDARFSVNRIIGGIDVYGNGQ